MALFLGGGDTQPKGGLEYLEPKLAKEEKNKMHFTRGDPDQEKVRR